MKDEEKTKEELCREVRELRQRLSAIMSNSGPVSAVPGGLQRHESGSGTAGMDVSGGLAFLRKMEGEMLRSQRIDSLGLLASGISHEFNNILTAVIGNIILARMYAKPESEVSDILSEALKAARRAEELTRQLLTFSKREVLFKKVTVLRDQLLETAGFLSNEHGVRCELSVADSVSPVDVDAGQFRQCLNAVVDYVLKGLDRQGKIEIAAENAAGPVSADLSGGPFVRISIGAGPLQACCDERLFDPLTGPSGEIEDLGMASAFNIVRKHDGCMTKSGRDGISAAYHIYLPVAQDVGMHEGSAEKTIYLSGRRRVLVMDDEEMIRNVIERMLVQCGCEADFSHDGEQMLREYSNALYAGRPYDAVIIDLVIVRGMGGREAIKRLRELDPHARAIVSSGYAEDPVLLDYRDYGFDGVLRKPYGITELSRVLYDVIMSGPFSR